MLGSLLRIQSGTVVAGPAHLAVIKKLNVVRAAGYAPGLKRHFRLSA